MGVLTHFLAVLMSNVRRNHVRKLTEELAMVG